MRSTNKSAVLDTSALVALLCGEPEAERIFQRIEQGGTFYVAAPTLLELRLILAGRLGRDAAADVESARERIGFLVLSFTEAHADAAFIAWQQYGKGRHPAGLNLGDCMTYGVAKVAKAELVYVGDDFSRTDLA